MDKPTLYQIRVKGHPDDTLASWFNAMAVSNREEGDALFSGPLPDQAALQGFINQISDLGLTLISINAAHEGDLKMNGITSKTMKEKILVLALGSSIMVPILYFGIQFLAAPFFPGYSFVSMIASELGSDLALHPAIFNIGTIITGIVTIIASVGFLLALQLLGTNPFLTWLTSLAVLLNGLGILQAGFFPLPDPRHNSNLATVGLFLFPILLTFALWKLSNARPIKTYLIITSFLGIASILIMSGASGLNTQGYEGLLQRIVALAFMVPVGIGSYFLLKRTNLNVVRP